MPDGSSQTMLVYDPLIGASEAIHRIKNIIGKIASLDTTVLLYGETGTGKKTVARMIHENSAAAQNRFVPVFAAGFPTALLAGALFGYEKNWPAGVNRQKCYFELAHNGTLFIDEVGEIDAVTQARLLRVLQNSEFYRTGSGEAPRYSARLVAATNKNLKRLVKNGVFRQDLFYRLNILTLEIPPLRERREDIPLLAQHFVEKYAQKHNLPRLVLRAETLIALQSYSWPGNVLELKNVIEHLFAPTVATWLAEKRLCADFIKREPVKMPGDQFLPFPQAKVLFERDFILSELRRVQRSRANSPQAPLSRQPLPDRYDVNHRRLYAPKNFYDLEPEIDCLN